MNGLAQVVFISQKVQVPLVKTILILLRRRVEEFLVVVLVEDKKESYPIEELSN